ncbi:MAG: prolipoprotein diacylglyceryl transferase family protein [Acutalibacteraceae bacterium]
MYGIIYSVSRFIIEFFRGDNVRGFFLNLSTSGWISILLFLFSLSGIFLLSKKSSGSTPNLGKKN